MSKETFEFLAAAPYGLAAFALFEYVIVVSNVYLDYFVFLDNEVQLQFPHVVVVFYSEDLIFVIPWTVMIAHPPELTVSSKMETPLVFNSFAVMVIGTSCLDLVKKSVACRL